MRHLLDIADLGADGIDEVLRLTDSFVEVSARAIPKVPTLRGKTVVSVFFEDSTRTRLSFDAAAKRLGADTMTFSAGSSSLKKGESIRDTVQTIEAMGVDALVVRHASSGVPAQIARWSSSAVINAGDGWHQHPTQALLDCYTIRQRLGSLAGRRIAIVGDIKHSRVARSDVTAFTLLGAEVTLVAPPTLLPPSLEGWPVTVSHDLDDVLDEVDVVYLLRMQRERMTESLVPSLREYTSQFGLTTARADRSEARGALIMHPGPMNRGVEIAAEVADRPNVAVVDQVRNGVPVRMAVLFLMLGSGREAWTSSAGPGETDGSAVDELVAAGGQRVSVSKGRPVEDRDRVRVIKGGTVVDRNGRRSADVLLDAGQILAVEPDIDVPARAQVLDAAGCLVTSAFVDLHTHLRQPGREDAETIESAGRAAVLGGYAYLVAMPNTDPAMDSVEVIEWVRDVARREAVCQVVPSAAITVARGGTALSPMAELAGAGVTMFTDDGNGVQDDLLMRRAMEYASGLRPAAGHGPITLAQHCEIDALAAGGCMNEGEWSSRLGLPGIPAQAEELMVSRDLALARLTGCRIHFQHLSTAGSVELVRAAKAAGLAVTAEATPHHFTLTEAELAGYDPVFKVNPPLRTRADVDAIKGGLADGTIDAIATDHAPHTQDAKELPLDQAPPGMLGLETALALALTELDLPIEQVLALLSWNPASILGGAAAVTAGRMAPPEREGTLADLVVIDPAATWTVDPNRLASRSRNTPYAGRTLTGRVRHTIVQGDPVVVDGEVQE